MISPLSFFFLIKRDDALLCEDDNDEQKAPILATLSGDKVISAGRYKVLYWGWEGILNPCPSDTFETLSNRKSLQATILKLMKRAGISPDG